MKAVAIFAIAALVGVVVYGLSGRRARGELAAAGGTWVWEDRPPDDTLPAGPSVEGEGADPFAFERTSVAAHRPFRSRLLGVLGLIVLVGTAGMVLAATLWQAGHMINQQIANFLEK